MPQQALSAWHNLGHCLECEGFGSSDLWNITDLKVDMDLTHLAPKSDDFNFTMQKSRYPILRSSRCSAFSQSVQILSTDKTLIFKSTDCGQDDQRNHGDHCE